METPHTCRQCSHVSNLQQHFLLHFQALTKSLFEVFLDFTNRIPVDIPTFTNWLVWKHIPHILSLCSSSTSPRGTEILFQLSISSCKTILKFSGLKQQYIISQVSKSWRIYLSRGHMDFSYGSGKMAAEAGISWIFLHSCAWHRGLGVRGWVGTVFMQLSTWLGSG